MDKAVIRRAGTEDTEEIRAMVREMDSSDYLQETWKVWMQGAETVQLVALVDGRIAGCVHGRFSAGQSAWAQGLRIRTDCRRLGVATSLMTALEEELRREGARTVFATISRFNQPSLATVARRNWKIVLSVIRRRLNSNSPQSVVKNLPLGRPAGEALAHRPSLDFPEISRVIRPGGFPASRRAATFFRRVYFPMTEEFLREALAAGVVKTNAFPAAVAILDPELSENKELWVIAISGAPSGLALLFTDLALEAAQNEFAFVVDSPDDPEIQALLDDLGFSPAKKDGQFIVAEKKLLPAV
jgi:N-acetylglutamate synthase-like GNAT family acetyltransferase